MVDFALFNRINAEATFEVIPINGAGAIVRASWPEVVGPFIGILDKGYTAEDLHDKKRALMHAMRRDFTLWDII